MLSMGLAPCSGAGSCAHRLRSQSPRSATSPSLSLWHRSHHSDRFTVRGPCPLKAGVGDVIRDCTWSVQATHSSRAQQMMPPQAEVTAAEHLHLLQKLKDPQVLKDLTEDAVVWATQHGLVRWAWDRMPTVPWKRSIEARMVPGILMAVPVGATCTCRSEHVCMSLHAPARWHSVPGIHCPAPSSMPACLPACL